MTLSSRDLIAEEELRRCLAMGAGHLCQIEMEDKADSWQTYRALALSRKELGADFILCGKEFLDYQNGQVGAFGEHHLWLPFVR